MKKNTRETLLFLTLLISIVSMLFSVGRVIPVIVEIYEDFTTPDDPSRHIVIYKNLGDALENPEQVRYLDLSNQNLEALPEDFARFSSLEHLNLKGNAIKKFPGVLYGLKHLQFLDLSGNQIEEIPVEIGKMKQLEELYLSENPLKIISGQVFKLERLKSITMFGNGLIPDSLDVTQTLYFDDDGQSRDNIFSIIMGIDSSKHLLRFNWFFNYNDSDDRPLPQMKSLEELRDLPTVTNWEEALKKPEEVYKLDLSDRGLEEIPDEIWTFPNIQILDLRFNDIESVPETINQLKHLQALYLGGNRIANIPDAIGDLQQLIFLDLESNQVASIPGSVGNAAKLEFLDIRSNLLTSLPEEIGRLKQLNYLNVNRNQLTSLPAGIYKLKSLEFLSAETNRITSLKKGIGRLESLIHLYLAENRIKKIPTDIFDNAELESLSLSGNLISAVPESIRKVNHRFLIDLRGNQITDPPYQLEEIDTAQYNLAKNPVHEALGEELYLQLSEELLKEERTFSSVKEALIKPDEVRDLNLRGKELKVFPEEIFQFKNLIRLTVGNNQIRSVPSRIGELKKLKFLELSWNLIEELPEEIYSLKYLTEFTAYQNDIELISPSIGKLKNLELLGFSGNRIRELPREIGNLKRLKTLYLDNNNIPSIPDSMAGIETLEYLNANNNDLRHIPNKFIYTNWHIGLSNTHQRFVYQHQLNNYMRKFAQISDLFQKTKTQPGIKVVRDFKRALKNPEKVEGLDLSGKKLTKLPNEITRFKNLKYLNLGDNLISEVPIELHQLRHLSILDLSYNRLSDLKGLVKIKTLTHLILNHNQLNRVKLVSLKSLEYLDLDHNHIQGFSTLDLPVNLKYLHLGYNRNIILTPGIGKLKNLKDLNLEKCGLQVFPDDILHLKNLSYLNLSDNHLRRLPRSIRSLKKLEALYLSGNRFSKIPAALGYMKSIHCLNMNHNQVTHLPEWFKNLSQLRELFLRNNGLTYANNHVIHFENLGTLDLRNNPIPYGANLKEGMIDTTVLYSRPKVSSLSITNFGIIRKKKITKKKEGRSYPSVEYVIAKSTTEIPAKKGLLFGIEYQAKGTPDGMDETFTVELEHPLIQGKTISQDEVNVKLGQKKISLFWFENEAELIKGEWTFFVKHGEDSIRKTFHVF